MPSQCRYRPTHSSSWRNGALASPPIPLPARITDIAATRCRRQRLDSHPQHRTIMSPSTTATPAAQSDVRHRASPQRSGSNSSPGRLDVRPGQRSRNLDWQGQLSTQAPDAFLEAVVASRTRLLRTARARLRNIEWAKDAVSETLLVALERRPGFDDAARVQAWLNGILHHKVVDQIRLHLDSRLVFENGDDDESSYMHRAEASNASDPIDRACSTEFTAALACELKLLSANQAQAFVLCDGWGKSTAEASEELGVTPGNLNVILHRARRRLRTSLHAHQV